MYAAWEGRGLMSCSERFISYFYSIGQRPPFCSIKSVRNKIINGTRRRSKSNYICMGRVLNSTARPVYLPDKPKSKQMTVHEVSNKSWLYFFFFFFFSARWGSRNDRTDYWGVINNKQKPQTLSVRGKERICLK